MKFLIFLFVSVLILLPAGKAEAQSFPLQKDLTRLENTYNDLQSSYEKEKSVLDSLQARFKKRVGEINYEKDRTNPDNEKITSLMSNSVNLSNNIDAQQKKIDKIGKSVTSVKIQLNEKYTGIIDSLKNIRIKGKENQEKIDNLILFYATKRLEVTPEIYSLSFNPYKILELDLQKSKDSAYKRIYSEYLTGAVNEVNNILANISKESNEINQVVELQKKASRFVEETELESGITSGKLSQTDEKNPAAETGTETSTGFYNNFDGARAKNNSLTDNIKIYEELLNQLNTIKSLSVRQMPDVSIQAIGEEIDLNSYDKLLNEVKKRLIEYKRLLMQKSGSLQ
ncbi:MAG: hypothetical protein WCE54_22355 [Ignavibacteriaceae bacterium]